MSEQCDALRPGYIRGLPFKATPGKRLHIHAIIMTKPEPVLPLKGIWPHLRLCLSRVVQSFRLMVGVRDYQAYLLHLQTHHPEQQPMSEKQFHRYCVDARYGGKGGKLNKCPC